jgi:cytidylate kinase
MYRASAFLVKRYGIDPARGSSAAELISGHSIDVSSRGVFLDGEDISREIRTPEISEASSVISAHPEVRAELVRLQKAFGGTHDTVAEGRDMGTVVFPDADLKVYVVADIAIRAMRRLRDLGGGSMTEVVRAMFRRDHRDRNRADSPLRLPPGALWLDGTFMTVDDQVRFVIRHYRRLPSQ